MSHISDESEYARGHRQGEIKQELHEHEVRLDKINGSMERVASSLGALTQQLTEVVQGIARIDQAMTADKETVKQTAAALRDQADVAGSRDMARWTPLNRAMLLVGSLGGMVGVAYLFLH